MEKSSYFEDTKELINTTMHKYLYALMKYMIFGKPVKNFTKEKLKKFVELLKEKYKIELEISFKSPNINWNIDNLNKIISLIKKQNFALSIEIIENILIRLLSLAFKNKASEFFGKYIYNNLRCIRKEKFLFENWMDNDLLSLLFNRETCSLKDIMEYDYAISSGGKNNDGKSNY